MTAARGSYNEKEIKEKFNTLFDVAKRCEPEEPGGPVRFKNLSRAFGNEEGQFSSVGELESFMEILKAAHPTHEIIRAALDAYKDFRLTEVLEAKNVRHMKAQVVAIPSNPDRMAELQHIRTESLNGFKVMQETVVKAAADLNEALDRDSKNEERKREVLFNAVKLALGVANAGSVACLLQSMVDAVNSTPQVEYTAGVAYQAYADATNKLVDEAVRKLNTKLGQLKGEQFSTEATLLLTEEFETILTEIGAAHEELHRRLIELSSHLTDHDIKAAAESVWLEFNPAVETSKHMTDSLVSTLHSGVLAKKNAVVTNMLEAQERNLFVQEATKLSASPKEKEHIKGAIRRSVCRTLGSQFMGRDYIAAVAKHPSQEAPDTLKIAGFAAMTKGKDVQYFPVGLVSIPNDPAHPLSPDKKQELESQRSLTLALLNPTTGMHSGGRYIREFLYNQFPEVQTKLPSSSDEVPLYGYKPHGKIGHNKMSGVYQERTARIEDRGRAIGVLASILPPCESVASNQQIADAVIKIMQINVHFKKLGGYEAHMSKEFKDTQGKQATLSPLFVFLNTPDYMALLKRPDVPGVPSVKELMKREITDEMILQCITDPNLKGPEDKVRLNNTLFAIAGLLKELGYPEATLKEIIKTGNDYIDFQCSNPITQLEKRVGDNVSLFVSQNQAFAGPVDIMQNESEVKKHREIENRFQDAGIAQLQAQLTSMEERLKALPKTDDNRVAASQLTAMITTMAAIIRDKQKIEEHRNYSYHVLTPVTPTLRVNTGEDSSASPAPSPASASRSATSPASTSRTPAPSPASASLSAESPASTPPPSPVGGDNKKGGQDMHRAAPASPKSSVIAVSVFSKPAETKVETKRETRKPIISPSSQGHSGGH